MTEPSIEALGQAVEATLTSNLDALPEGRLREAMRYAVLGGGKRLRPLLCLAACVDAGGSHTDAMLPACAIELIHCYSLVHDDLPCMDDDDERRGRPSLHRAFDEATALLAGDALQSLAFQLIAQAPDNTNMLRELSEASGASGMAGGQMLDLQSSQPENRNLDNLKQTQAMKTGALFRASLRLGLLSAGQPADLLDEFSQIFGLAFQMSDDLRDCLGTAEDLGRPPGSDARNSKLTWPSLLGAERARAKLVRFCQVCTDKLQELPFNSVYLSDLAKQALPACDES